MLRHHPILGILIILANFFNGIIPNIVFIDYNYNQPKIGLNALKDLNCFKQSNEIPFHEMTDVVWGLCYVPSDSWTFEFSSKILNVLQSAKNDFSIPKFN